MIWFWRSEAIQAKSEGAVTSLKSSVHTCIKTLSGFPSNSSTGHGTLPLVMDAPLTVAVTVESLSFLTRVGFS